MRYLKKIVVVLFCLLTVSAAAQTYPKDKGVVRILTYNTHYCKGATDPGEINKENVEKFAQVIKALDADIVALQELDSASVHRGSRFLLKDIADATGIDYTPIYANAAPFDNGSIGCGVLVKNKFKIKNAEVIPLPGDEPRAAVVVELKKMTFVSTHSDLNNNLRKEGAEIVCNHVKDINKPVFLAGDLNDSHRWANGGISFPIWQEYFQIISDTQGNTIPGRTDNGALIDYVLLLNNKKSSKVKVNQTHIVRSILIDGKNVDTSTVSDHYPVFVDVKL